MSAEQVSFETPLAESARLIAAARVRVVDAVDGQPGDAVEEFIAEVTATGHARLRAYEGLVLQASSGERVDARKLLAAGAAVARPPHRVVVDLQAARKSYLAWRSSFNPV